MGHKCLSLNGFIPLTGFLEVMLVIPLPWLGFYTIDLKAGLVYLYE